MPLLLWSAFAFAEDTAPVPPAPPMFAPTFHLRVDSAGFSPEALAVVTSIFRDEWARRTLAGPPLACPLEGCGEREEPWIWLTVAGVGGGASVAAYRYADDGGVSNVSEAVPNVDDLPRLLEAIAHRMIPPEAPVPDSSGDTAPAPEPALADAPPDARPDAPPDVPPDVPSANQRPPEVSLRDNLPGARIGIGLPVTAVIVPVVTIAYAHRVTDRSGFSEWEALVGIPTDFNFQHSVTEVSTTVGRAFSIHQSGGEIFFGGGGGIGIVIHEYPQVAGVFYAEAGWLNGSRGEQRWFVQGRSRVLVSTDGQSIPVLTVEAGIGF